MTRMSASCRRRADGSAAGFSLLELLVVLALVSIMVALVAPRLAGTVRAVATSGDRAEVARQIERLPLLARSSGRALRFMGDTPVIVEGMALPEGWTVSAASPLMVAANGICGPAQVKVEGAGVVETWRVASPDCSVGHDR